MAFVLRFKKKDWLTRTKVIMLTKSLCLQTTDDDNNENDDKTMTIDHKIIRKLVNYLFAICGHIKIKKCQHCHWKSNNISAFSDIFGINCKTCLLNKMMCKSIFINT